MRQQTFSASNRKGIKGVLYDLRHGFSERAIWTSFAWDEIQNRYRRSLLGILWIAISYLFFVVVIVLFFRGLNQADPGFFLRHVALGLAAYSFLIANVTDGCEVFRNSKTWIKSTPLPYSIYIFKSIARSAFTFVINIIVGFFVIAMMGWKPGPEAFLSLLAIPIFLLNAVSLQMVFGLVATRFRDVAHLVATVTRILFFTTPILWTLDQRNELVRSVAMFNPMTHFIEIFRAPLAGTEMMPQSWPIVLGLTVVSWAAAILAGSVMMRRIPYWL